jgi:excisionase family DNA binding protein
VVPVHAEPTTQEAADMLNVSRPHWVKTLKAGRLKFTKAGRHRRVLFAHRKACKTQREQHSADAMNALAQQAQELRMGYE